MMMGSVRWGNKWHLGHFRSAPIAHCRLWNAWLTGLCHTSLEDLSSEISIWTAAWPSHSDNDTCISLSGQPKLQHRDYVWHHLWLAARGQGHHSSYGNLSAAHSSTHFWAFRSSNQFAQPTKYYIYQYLLLFYSNVSLLDLHVSWFNMYVKACIRFFVYLCSVLVWNICLENVNLLLGIYWVIPQNFSGKKAFAFLCVCWCYETGDREQAQPNWIVRHALEQWPEVLGCFVQKVVIASDRQYQPKMAVSLAHMSSNRYCFLEGITSEPAGPKGSTVSMHSLGRCWPIVTLPTDDFVGGKLYFPENKKSLPVPCNRNRLSVPCNRNMCVTAPFYSYRYIYKSSIMKILTDTFRYN